MTTQERLKLGPSSKKADNQGHQEVKTTAFLRGKKPHPSTAEVERKIVSDTMTQKTML